VSETVAEVGIIGLGVMGSAMAANLLHEGFAVTGHDIVDAKVEAHVARGGKAAASAREVAVACEIVITSLDTVAGFTDVVAGPDGLVAGAHEGLVVADTSTFPLEVKHTARDRLAAAGVVLLDCTLSGTGAQAARRDLVVYGSGPQEAFARCRPVLAAVSRSVWYLGAFGAGSKMKYVANLLVAIHNVAAAEAFVLGRRAGLDPQQLYEVIRDGAGTSRMFEVRGPMMVAQDYDDAHAALSLFLKDVDIIHGFARSVSAPLPLFSATIPLYTAGLAQGRAAQDPAAVHAVLEGLATPRPSGADTAGG